MMKTMIRRERLSIDILPQEHRMIKTFAAMHGETIREYVLECIRERLKEEAEKKEMSGLIMRLDQDPVFKEVWDNDKDASYDRV